MAGTVESEVKLVCTDVDALVASNPQLGWAVQKSRHFEDNFIFDLPSEALAKSGSILRIRVVDGVATLTYKGLVPESATSAIKVREELETGVAQATTVATILERLGMRRVFRYQKYRTVYVLEYENERFLAMYDETPMGNFLEIEGSERGVVEVAKLLGYRPNEFVNTSYIGLQVSFCRARGVPLQDLVFGADSQTGARERAAAAGGDTGTGAVDRGEVRNDVR